MSSFLTRVAELCQEPGRRAVLWRNRGETLTSARQIGFLLPYLHGEQPEVHFLVATLLAGDRKALIHFHEHGALPEQVPQSLGATLDQAERAAAPDANALKRKAQPDPNRTETPYERRLRRLLDARLDEEDGTGELPFLLRQAVQQVCSQADRPYVHWQKLLDDVLRWNKCSKPTQKKWARDFYGAARATGDANPEATEQDIEQDRSDKETSDSVD